MPQARVSLPAPLNAFLDLTGVGSEEFIERTKEELGTRAKGREVREMDGHLELREPGAYYKGHFGHENDDIGPRNTYFWNDYLKDSDR